MNLFPLNNLLASQEVLGVQVVGETVRSARLTMGKEGPKIVELEANNVKPLDMDQLFLISGLSGKDVLSRSLSLPLKKKRDIDAVLAYQVEPLLPYSLEEAVFVNSPLSENNSHTELLISATKKQTLTAHLKQLENLGYLPEIVSTNACALTLFAHYYTPASGPKLIIHLDENETQCVIAHGKKLLGSHPLNATFSNLEELKIELKRSILALGRQCHVEAVSSIVLTGSGATTPELKEELSQALEQPFTVPINPDPYSITEMQTHAVTIGLALCGLISEVSIINFRKKEFAHPNPWKRYQNLLTSFLGLCFISAVLIYIIGSNQLAHRDRDLKLEYLQILETMDRPYSSIVLNEQEKPLSQLSPEEIDQRVFMLQNELTQSPQTFPLFPDVPRVSDVLAWLATHTHVVDPVTGAPLLKIESFSYNLVKRPDQRKKREKYRVKVEVSFRTAVPKLARQFHDALITPNNWVDPQGEVKWSAGSGLYTTSFFLKNKPPKK